jgi:acetolactate synthase-1/2/3 large subunit
MARMTGGQALVRQLEREGARVVFGLPGVQLYGAMTAIRDSGIRFIATRHEQATTYMADGYARASGAFGTALVVPGPGLLNAAAGLSTAYAASSPVLVVAGQIPRTKIARHVGLLHEVDDQLDAIRPVTKWRRRVLEGSEVPGAVHAAVAQLRTGRPRPVCLDLPPETLEDEDEVELVEAIHPARAAADPGSLDRAAAALLAAERPVVYAGGGVHLGAAHEALRALAAHLQAGVVESPEGKGAVPASDDLALGAAHWPGTPVRAHLDAADVVLAVGSRLAVAGLRPGQAVVQVDVDPEEIGRNYPKTLPLCGDAAATLTELLGRLRAAGAPRTSRRDEREALRRATLAAADQEPQASILRSLRAGVPAEAIAVFDMTQLGYYSRPFWPVERPRTYFTSSYSGNLGFAFPTALGAKVARPDLPVVAVAGDGGFLFNVQELATAVRYGIAVVVVVFNDESYGNVARDLDESWGGSVGADLVNPDFVRLAEAFGVAAFRTKDPLEVGEAVREALALDRPALVEVPVGRMPRPKFFAPPRRAVRSEGSDPGRRAERPGSPRP